MSYCTLEDVQSEFKDTEFTSDTNVTDSDVRAFIANADALIDSYVGQRYAVPVTANASSLSLLNLFSRTLVADRVKKITEVKQTIAGKEANQDVRGSLSTKDVLAQLALIRDGDIALAGASTLNSSASFFSNNYQNSVSPEIKKGEKQW